MFSTLSNPIKSVGLNALKNASMMCTAAGTTRSYETLKVTVPKPFVYLVELNRPNQMNAMNKTMWQEIGQCFDELDKKDDCRSVVLAGAGKVFCAGIDLQDMAKLGTVLADHEDVARRCKILEEMIQNYQNYITSLERCKKPVIAAVQGACVGGGVDLITAADIRYCTIGAWFQVKEVDLGMAADVGTLQRLPKVIGSRSLVNELCLTARRVDSTEAKTCGLVSQVFDTIDCLISGAIGLAEEIAKKSPVAVQGTKRNLVYSRDHTVQAGLDDIRYWNMTMLQSEDFMNAAVALATKSPAPTFSKL